MLDSYPISFDLQGRTHSQTMMISSIYKGLAMPQATQGTDLLGPVACSSADAAAGPCATGLVD